MSTKSITTRSYLGAKKNLVSHGAKVFNEGGFMQVLAWRKTNQNSQGIVVIFDPDRQITVLWYFPNLPTAKTVYDQLDSAGCRPKSVSQNDPPDAAIVMEVYIAALPDLFR